MAGPPDEVPEICRWAIGDFARPGGTHHATAALGYLREAARLGTAAPQRLRARCERLAAAP